MRRALFPKVYQSKSHNEGKKDWNRNQTDSILFLPPIFGKDIEWERFFDLILNSACIKNVRIYNIVILWFVVIFFIFVFAPIHPVVVALVFVSIIVPLVIGWMIKIFFDFIP